MKTSSSTRLRFIAVGLAGACTLFALPATVAAKPTFREKINETIPDQEICGVVGTLRSTGTQNITIDDTTFRVTGQVKNVFTAADGRTAVISSAGTATGTFTDDGDGTFTINDTFKGLNLKVSSRGAGGVRVRGAGIISSVFTFNEETGEGTFEVVQQRGPHPVADDPALFCDAFLDALG